MQNRKIRKLSEVIEDALSNMPEKQTNFEQFLAEFRTRSYGIFIIILVLPCLIPGVSIIGGLCLLLFSVQMALGYEKVWIPRFIRNFKIDKKLIIKAFNYALPALIKIEKYIKPRFVFFTTSISVRIIGVIVSFFALIVMLPLPFSNLIPTISILFLALGLLQKDGLIIIASVFIGLLYSILFLFFSAILIQRIF